MKSISRKLFGLLLVLVMIAGMIPAASAEEPYELWIGGVQVTGETTSGEGWSFDAASNMISRIAAAGWRGAPAGVDPATYKPQGVI